MHKNYIGFTLLELLIVLIIVAIMCGIGFPAYQHLMAKVRADAAIFRLYRAIQLTRSEAIKHNAIATICPSSDQHHCIGKWQDGYLIFIDQRGDGQIDPEDKIIKIFPALQGKGSIVWKSFPKHNYLQMTPQGFPNNQNGTFYYTAAHNLYKIDLIINKTGRLRIQT